MSEKISLLAESVTSLQDLADKASARHRAMVAEVEAFSRAFNLPHMQPDKDS